MAHRISALMAPIVTLFASACSSVDRQPASGTGSSGDNPLLAASGLPLGMPAFDRIGSADFPPAFEQGMAEETEEVDRIATNREPATFENTLVALERSGRTLRRIRTTFDNLVSASTNEELETIRTEFAPRFSAHQDSIRLNSALFARIEEVYRRLDALGLEPEDRRLVERYRTDFVRAGAMLSDADKERLREMLRTLDPHSNFLEVKEYSTLQERQKGSYYGLGITVQSIDGNITVDSLFEGTPAFRLGIRAGDIICCPVGGPETRRAAYRRRVHRDGSRTRAGTAWDEYIDDRSRARRAPGAQLPAVIPPAAAALRGRPQ